jgi:predicted DNA-binding transcriptional regulator YafY
MSVRVDPVERVLNLLTLLHESAQPLTRAEIVDRMATGDTPYPENHDAQHQLFSSDRRTITVGLGIAIHQAVRGGGDAGRTEYWIDVDDVHLPRLDLADDERLVLSLALAAVSRTAPHAGEAMMKLSSWIGAAGGSVTAPFEFSVEMPDAVVALMEAARSGRVVRRTWETRAGEPVDEPDVHGAGDPAGWFEPWAVVLSDGSWFVVGHDDVPGVPVAVRVDRFGTSVETIEGTPRSVEPLDLDEETLTALLRGHAEPDELDVATVVVDDEDRFRSWVLALLDRATLVDPPWRRDELIGWIRQVADTPPTGHDVPPRPAEPGRRRGPEPVAARLHRLLSIVPWLYRQRSVAVAEVAERVGATVDQVVRDLTLASMCGAPPYGAGELYGFWVEPETDTVHVLNPTLLTDDVRLTPRQAASVAVALASVEVLPGEHQAAALRLREKLDDALGGIPVRVTLDDPPFLDLVGAAAERCERVRIEYIDPNDQLTERLVDPLKVFVDRGTSYVITDDHLRGEERVFRIDRIVSVTPTGEHFRQRTVTTPAGATWAWMVPDREVVVRLPPGSSWVLDRYATLAHVMDDDGWITVWLSVVDETWLAVLLLRCGPGAEVLAPGDLVNNARARAGSLLERYV